MTAPKFAPGPMPRSFGSAAPATPLAPPAPQPRRQPRPAPPQAPPHLSVVPDPSVQRARRRSRLLTGAAVLLAFLGLFGVVGVHVLLAQGQGDVQHLQDKVAQAEEAQRRLNLQVAQLESPDRVVAEAKNRLGMVAPSTVVPLASASLADPPQTTIPAPRPTTTVPPKSSTTVTTGPSTRP